MVNNADCLLSQVTAHPKIS